VEGEESMIWFFERDEESLKVETLYDEGASEYVVTVRSPDGEERIERFKNLEAFRVWIEAFDRKLAFDQWVARNGPIILPYGWPNKRVM
jgi:hypothetical protein